jgi:hypothetical protein
VHDSIGYTIQQLNATVPANSTLLAQKTSSGIIEPGKYISVSTILMSEDINNVPQQAVRGIPRCPSRHTALLLWNHAGFIIVRKRSGSFSRYLKSVHPVVVESANYIGRYRIPAYALNNNDASVDFGVIQALIWEHFAVFQMDMRA